MKYIVLFLLFLSASLFAQEEMTKEEWQAEMNRMSEKKVALVGEKSTLESEVAELKATNESLMSYDDCMKSLYQMVGATESDINDFRLRVNALEGKINRREEPKDDRQAELDALKNNKISALPEFYNKVHNEMQRMLDSWIIVPKEVMYTVVKGDHLWGIAKKDQHYGNPFAWPMIYKANQDQIKNPDLIYPKQVFKIPNLTEEEKAKYDKIRRNYKPAPMQQSSTSAE